MENAIVSLVLYLNFEGNCEEALNYYQEILGGRVEIKERYDNPVMHAPNDYKNKVLHGSLHFGNHTILASDIFPGGEAKQGSGDASLSITVNDPEKGKEIFDQLAEGGKVKINFEKQFWGAWHGGLRDRYGVNWMVNCEEGEVNK